MSTMSGEFYLVISVKGKGYPELAARLAVRQPSLRPGEVALQLSVSVPKSLFARPTLHASVTVPADQVSQPVITAEVSENIAAALSQQLGVTVHVSADPALAKESP